MRLDEAIVVRLRATAAIVALVDDRVYQGDNVPQVSRYARIIVEDDQRERVYHFGGETDVIEGRMDVYAQSRDANQCKRIADAIESALSGFRGTITQGGDSVTIKKFHLDDSVPEPIDPRLGTNENTYQVRVTFRSYHEGD